MIFKLILKHVAGSIMVAALAFSGLAQADYPEKP